MIRKLAVGSVAIAAIAFVSACQNDRMSTEPDVQASFASAASAAGGTEVNESNPVNIPVFISCANGGAGENVLMSGELHTLINFRADNNGGFGVKMHYQPQGLVGTGSVTGDKYQGTGVTQQNGNVKAGEEFTFINNFRMVGQGPGNNFSVQEKVHYTINANGTLTSTHDRLTVDCK